MGNVLTGWLVEELLSVALILFLRFFVVMLVRVKGRSMEPTLHHRDILLVTHYARWTRQPQHFDVVICRYPNRKGYFVKRIVGLPGDTLRIAEGLLTVNGETYPEEWLAHRPRYTVENYTVPEGCYYVLGDNRANSNDSHLIGPLTRRQIRGRVRQVLYPFSTRRKVQ